MTSPALNPPKAEILGYRIAVTTLEQAVTWCLNAVQRETPKLLVTLNPEIIIQAEADPALKQALLTADLSVADGVGVVWAARRAGITLPERVPGVDLSMRLLERGGPELSVFFLGAKPGVAERAAAEAQQRFGTTIAGNYHGYFDREHEAGDIVKKVRDSGAQLLLAGLGEGQELFLHTHREALNIPLMIGVGGTLDVLAGEVQRTPAWTRQLGVEWAWRVGLDPKRWHRFPRLLRFVTHTLKNRQR